MTAPTPIRHEAIYAEAPATAAVSDTVHNLVQTMSEKLDAVWRYDKYLEDCRGNAECTRLFQRMKEDDLEHVQMLRGEIERMCNQGLFR